MACLEKNVKNFRIGFHEMYFDVLFYEFWQILKVPSVGIRQNDAADISTFCLGKESMLHMSL